MTIEKMIEIAKELKARGAYAETQHVWFWTPEVDRETHHPFDLFEGLWADPFADDARREELEKYCEFFVQAVESFAGCLSSEEFLARMETDG